MLQTRSKIIIAVVSAGVLATTASAELMGLRVFREEPGGPGQPPLGAERWIYRVYAEFSEPTDMVGSWGTGFTTFGFGGIWNITEDNALGSGFTNIPDLHTGDVAPFGSGTFADWDTYMTIGLLYGTQGPEHVDYTITFPDTQMFIASGSTSWEFGGVGLLGDIQQGYANYRVNGNDTDTRVLLMQLVVNAGEHVHGSIGVRWRSAGDQFIVSTDLSFNSIPAPSATFLLLVYVLQGRRTRR